MNKPLRIAVAGVGSFGLLHARTLAALPEVDLVAVVDADVARARAVAAELKLAYSFQSLPELLSTQIADALVIATRADSHAILAETALAAGLHVLIEKPVATSVPEITALEQLSRSAQRVAMAGHICIFHSQVGPVIGRVQKEGFRTAHFVRHRPAEHRDSHPNEHPMQMTMVHDLYVLAQMVDNEEPAVIDGLDAAQLGADADLSWAVLRWPDGRTATLHSHWALPPGAPADGWDYFEIFGSSFYCKVSTNPQPVTWTEAATTWPSGLEISTCNGRPTGMLAEELRSFVEACRGKPVPPGCRMSDAREVQQWVEQLMRSAQARRQSEPQA